MKNSTNTHAEAGVIASLQGLIKEGQAAKNLKLAQKVPAKSHFLGSKKSFLRGRGMEYLESRPYVYQDEIRHLDWKVTARLGEAYTKVFAEEKERPTFLIVDLRSNMFFGSTNCFKSVLACKIAATLAFLTHQGSDKLGGFILTDWDILEFKPSAQKKSLAHFLGALAKASENALKISSLTKAPPNFWEGVFSRIYHNTHPGSAIFILSDFFDLSSDIKKSLFRLRKKADIFAFFINDPIEKNLPKLGLVGVSFASQNLNINLSSQKSQELYRQYIHGQAQEKQELFRALKILSFAFSTENLSYHQKLGQAFA